MDAIDASASDIRRGWLHVLNLWANDALSETEQARVELLQRRILDGHLLTEGEIEAIRNRTRTRTGSGSGTGDVAVVLGVPVLEALPAQAPPASVAIGMPIEAARVREAVVVAVVVVVVLWLIHECV